MKVEDHQLGYLMIEHGKYLLSIKKNQGIFRVIHSVVIVVISRSRTGERSDQFKCLDDNECVIGNNYCVDEEKGGICLNIDGSFTCTCQEGYTGDGNDYQKYTRLTQSGSGSKLIYDY